jgi:signal transduction histidine kinase
MDQCIQMFLDFARPPHAERRRTDLIDVVRRAAALMEGRVRRQKVTLVTNLPEISVYAMIDPDQIHQVVVNLLLNALDALPRGGTVQLSVDCGPFSKDTVDGRKATGPYVEVQIRDSGPGIAPRIRERLFQPFVSSKETGVGLGLSICKRLIEDHGGAILGDNDPQGGAVFVFRLPVEIQQGVASAK